MTVDHWLTIAVIISTLTAPLMPAVAGWKRKPKASPETNHPKERIPGWLRFAVSPYFPLLLIVLPNIFVLYYEDIRRPKPVTVSLMLDMCFHTFGIVYGLTLFHLNSIARVVTEHMDLTESMNRLERHMAEIIGRIIHILEAQAEERPSPQRENLLRRLLEVAKRVFKKEENSN